jgi:3-deoxy-D-manno-octulosonate 8-phosphate phosphatase (KDO 8-P phosphatase)
MPAALAEPVKLVVFDVDGVLTDGGVYVGTTASGEAMELKRFDIQDGFGLKLLQWAGIAVAMVSGRVSAATEVRAKELGVECHQDPDAHKLPIVEGLMRRMGIGWDNVAMLADDLPDLAVYRKAGLKAAVANASAPIAEMADWRAARSGGRGAAREFCDALLSARGDLEWVIRKYVDERSGP